MNDQDRPIKMEDGDIVIWDESHIRTATVLYDPPPKGFKVKPTSDRERIRWYMARGANGYVALKKGEEPPPFEPILP